MPDVLLIVTDDQRDRTIDWMDAVGRRILERGTRYPNGMIPTSVCCPSRASLLTGLFAHSTGVWSNGRSDDIPHTGGWSVFHAAGLEDRTLGGVAAAGRLPHRADRQVPERLRRLPGRIRAAGMDHVARVRRAQWGVLRLPAAPHRWLGDDARSRRLATTRPMCSPASLCARSATHRPINRSS